MSQLENMKSIKGLGNNGRLVNKSGWKFIC